MPNRKNNRAARAFRGRIIHTLSADEVVDIRDGLMLVDGDGRIIACGEYDELIDRCEGVEIDHFKYRLIIPGLVDCHLHLPQLDQRGRFGATLFEWLEEYIIPAEQAFDDPKVVDDVGRRFFKKLILNGTTTSSIYGTTHEDATHRAFELAELSGVRAVIGKVMMDRHIPFDAMEDTAQAIDSSMRLHEKWHGREGERLRYALTPRFAPSCSMQLWYEIGRIMETTDVYVQSHIAETQEEVENMRELFPAARDYFEMFEKAGVVGPKVILGHAIYLSDDEYRRMAETDTRIAHCPTSNFFLKSGCMSIKRVDEAGVKFAFGTDVGAGTTMSLFGEMRHSDFAQRDMHLLPGRALYLATLGGARVLSYDDVVGNFLPGKYADFCVIDIKKLDFYYELESLSTMDVLSLIMYRGAGHIIDDTYVAGRPLDVDVLNVI
jgi:guanine deaminase